PKVVSVSADDTPDPKAIESPTPSAGPSPITSISLRPVSGCLRDAGLAWYSNCGEVMTDGYAAGHPDGIGTSFAAPRVAAAEALYLMATGAAMCSGHQPPLNSVDYDESVTATWDNVARADWDTVCADFSAHATLHPVTP